MIAPARSFFDSLDSWSSLEDLVQNGEPEGQYLEVKAVGEPRLQQGQRGHLSQALSGFANSAGGVLLWGASTTRHAHTGLDVVTQLEPFGNSRSFQKQVDVAIPTLAYPVVEGSESKTIHPTAGATKGIVITYIPRSQGDPIEALAGAKGFWLRSGAEFVEMPYETLRRLFAATTSPDLTPVFDQRVITKDANGLWTIPIVIRNNSSAVAERYQVSVGIKNFSACEVIQSPDLRDVSIVNPGERLFMQEVPKPLYRGLDQIVGNLQVSMKKGKRPRRVLTVGISIYANRFRARQWIITLQLAKKGFGIKKITDRFIY